MATDMGVVDLVFVGDALHYTDVEVSRTMI